MIEGVIIKELTRYGDERGWLAELFRVDEMDEALIPAMSYVSLTRPRMARGPHEHLKQTDYFCFAGPSTFKLYLWDNRNESATYGEKAVITAGEAAPKIVVIPPRVVHAYKNIGTVDGFVFNAPNRLYRGRGKKEDVDEIRYEGKKDTAFVMD